MSKEQQMYKITIDCNIKVKSILLGINFKMFMKNKFNFQRNKKINFYLKTKR